MARVRVPILLLLLTVCGNAFAGEVVLLTYSGEGAVTTPVIVNTGAVDVKYPDSKVCDPLGCRVIPGLVVKAGAVARLAIVKPTNGVIGAYRLELPDPGLVAYSEIVTGGNALFRCGPLPAVDHVRYLDLAAPGRYNSWLVIIADGPTVVSFNGKTVSLGRDDGVLLPGPLDGHIEFVSQLGAAKFYAVAGINDPVTGSQQLVDPH